MIPLLVVALIGAADQVCISTRMGNTGTGMPLASGWCCPAQSFTAVHTGTIQRIDARISGSCQMKLSIRKGLWTEDVVGESVVRSGTNDMTPFTFNPPLEVVKGEVYTMHPIMVTGRCSWTVIRSNAGDTYTGGVQGGYCPAGGCSPWASDYVFRVWCPGTFAPATLPPSTNAPSTQAPDTKAPATVAPLTVAPATQAPGTNAPSTQAPDTKSPATLAPPTVAPPTVSPNTEAPATEAPKTNTPSTVAPKTSSPLTASPMTAAPSTVAPKTEAPSTEAPNTQAPATLPPSTDAPDTVAPPTRAPMTAAPVKRPPYMCLSTGSARATGASGIGAGWCCPAQTFTATHTGPIERIDARISGGKLKLSVRKGIWGDRVIGESAVTSGTTGMTEFLFYPPLEVVKGVVYTIYPVATSGIPYWAYHESDTLGGGESGGMCPAGGCSPHVKDYIFRIWCPATFPRYLRL